MVDNWISFAIGGAVGFVLGWHLMPRPLWMTNLIAWYHGEVKAVESFAAHPFKYYNGADALVVAPAAAPAATPPASTTGPSA